MLRKLLTVSSFALANCASAEWRAFVGNPLGETALAYGMPEEYRVPKQLVC